MHIYVKKNLIPCNVCSSKLKQFTLSNLWLFLVLNETPNAFMSPQTSFLLTEPLLVSTVSVRFVASNTLDTQHADVL